MTFIASLLVIHVKVVDMWQGTAFMVPMGTIQSHLSFNMPTQGDINTKKQVSVDTMQNYCFSSEIKCF